MNTKMKLIHSDKFTGCSVKDSLRRIKGSEYFYDTDSIRATEYLRFINDAKNDRSEAANNNFPCPLDKKFIGFFRSSPHEDCILFSLVDTHKQEILHCRYKILENGSIVNLLNLRAEGENAPRYANINEFVDARSKNMHILSRAELKSLIRQLKTHEV